MTILNENFKRQLAVNYHEKTGTDIDIFYEKVIVPVFNLAEKHFVEFEREYDRIIFEEEKIQFFVESFYDILKEKIGEDDAETIIEIITDLIKKTEEDKWKSAKNILMG